MAHPYFEQAQYPRVLAHRGLVVAADERSIAPWENTAAAFAAAHAAGAEYIETDCRLTLDGDVVLFHDDTLERLLGDRRAVDTVRTAELAELLADHGGLLTVTEALEAFPDTRFNIDVKTSAAALPLGEAVSRATDRVLITSFADANRRTALQAVRRAGAPRPPAVSGGRETIAALRAATAVGLSAAARHTLRDVDALQIPERMGALRVLTPALLRAAHAAGVEVHVWTVNDPARMQALIASGVDGVVSDRADLAREALAPR